MDILDIRIYNDISKNDVNAMKDKEKVMLKGVLVTKRHDALSSCTQQTSWTIEESEK